MSASKGRQYDPTEELGIQKVQSIVSSFGWIPRDARKADFGIDLDVEFVGPDRKPTGRRIYVQVKSGPSYFSQGNKTHVHHYTHGEHVKYWNNHQGPVAIVLHDEAAGITIWEWTSEAVEVGKSWRISVPRAQLLNDSAKPIWAARAIEDVTLDPKKIDELGRDVAQQIKVPADKDYSTAYHTKDDISGTTQTQAQSPFGDGELPQAALAQIGRLLDDKLQSFRSPALDSGSDRSTDARRANEDQGLHAQIDQLRQIKNDGDPSVAYRMFDALIPKIDPTKQPFAYFRARTNRAACALEIGLEQEAVDEFVALWKIEKTNPHALANLALARLFERDYQGAFDAAVESLSSDDAPGHVLGVLFGAAARLELEGPPLDLVPDRLRESDDAQFALIEYMRVKADPEWIERAISAYESCPDQRVLKRLWMYAILEKVTSDRRAFPGGQLSVPLTELQAAAEALRAEVECKLSAGYHDKEELADEASNAAVAYRAMDQYEPGIDLLRRVLRYTGHQPSAVRMLGILEAIHGDHKAALETFGRVPDDGEAQLLKAEILGQDDPAQGLAHVLSIPEEALPEEHRASRWVIAATLAISAGDEDQAIAAIATLRKAKANEIFAVIFEARLKESQGTPVADLTPGLAEAADRINDETPFSVRLSLAETLRRFGAPLQASRVLDGFIDTSRDSQATRVYIQLLATSGRDRDFYRAFDALPKEAREDPEMLWLRAAHAFNHGDLDEAERQAHKLSTLRPHHLQPVLLTLEALIRRRKDAKVRALLSKPLETLEESSLSNRVRLGRLLIGFGYYQRGLELLYKLLLENRDDPKLWVNFGSAVLMSSRQKDAMFDTPRVSADVSATLKFDQNTLVEMVIEPNPAFRKLDPDAREPEHPDVQAIWDLEVGAEFTLPDGRTGSISDLRHKFVARMQSVLQQFEKRFPSASGFKSVQVDVKSEGGLDEIKAVLKERADFVEQEAQSYETGTLPLAVFAYRVGISTIDAAGGLGQTGRKFQVARGTPLERKAATVALRENAGKGAVVDAQTFDTIWNIGAMDAVISVVGKLHYAALTMDVLHARLEMIEASTNDEDGYRSMSYQDGRIALTSISREDVQRQKDDQLQAISWLEANGELCAVNLPDDLPDDMREAFASFEKPLFDEMFIAKEKDILLLVDDLHIRQWAHGFVPRSAWLHWVLGHAADEDKATLSEYTVWSAKLLANGQSYLGLSPQVFIQALSDDVAAGVAKPREVFIALNRCLGGVSADMDSHIRTACQVIALIWKDAKFKDIRESATGIILNAVTSGRQEDHSLILGVVVRVFRRHWWVANYIRGWARGHFLNIA